MAFYNYPRFVSGHSGELWRFPYVYMNMHVLYTYRKCKMCIYAYDYEADHYKSYWWSLEIAHIVYVQEVQNVHLCVRLWSRSLQIILVTFGDFYTYTWTCIYCIRTGSAKCAFMLTIMRQIITNHIRSKHIRLFEALNVQYIGATIPDLWTSWSLIQKIVLSISSKFKN